MRKRSRAQVKRIAAALTVLSVASAMCHNARAQAPAPSNAQDAEITRLSEAVQAAQTRLRNEQQQLDELQRQLSQLRGRHSGEVAGTAAVGPSAPDPPAPATEQTERQDLQAAQIATLNQDKVESASKYPVQLTGTILFNASINSAGVDNASVPVLALGGSGSTAFSLRQTIVGFNAQGPHLAGASSRADVRVDFFGTSTQGGYANAGGLLRLRTAHAVLAWKQTEAFVELDRPLISPYVPTSLTAVAEPALAWSGNLWSWSAQAGVSHTVAGPGGTGVRLQAALIDPPDAPATSSATPAGSSNLTSSATLAEASRFPGSEARIALLGHDQAGGFQIGVGGYFSPHRTESAFNFDSWAGSLDLRLPVTHRSELTGTFYRGQGLGGLGGGGYKDYLYRSAGPSVQVLAPDAAGGWAQWKQRLNPRWELNAAYGLDDSFARNLRLYPPDPSTSYSNIARNRTFFTNAIFSPRSSLLLSLEYRYLATSPVSGVGWRSDVFGAAAGYRF